MEYCRERSNKWRKKVLTVVAMLFCTAVLVMLPAKEVFAQATGTVTATSANIREKADAASTAIASVRNGSKLTITEQVTGADGKLWYKVFVDADSMGYVRGDLITKGEGSITDKTGDTTTNTNTTTTTTTTPATGTTTTTTPKVDTTVSVNLDGVEAVQPVGASVTKDNVRVRGDSSTGSGIVTTVKKDVAFTVHGTKINGSETWYQVSFHVNGVEVSGYIRSDYVKLDGELLPVADTTPVVDEPQQPEPEPEPVKEADYMTSEQDGVWYLIDNTGEQACQYKISSLITEAEKNANELLKTQKKVSKQTGVIVVMAILLVAMILGITLLVFKLKDLMEDEGFDREARNVRNRANGGARPTGARPAGARPAGTRPAGARPTGARPAGTRPAGARPTGARPAGARPEGARPTGARPAGTRPEGARPAGARPAGTRPEGARPAENRPVQTTVENKQTPKQNQWQSKNFMAEDDEFEFEFLNWDGEEEK